jgi:gamma-glutamyl-gamma-aminobutyrate hydrolase PuuD
MDEGAFEPHETVAVAPPQPPVVKAEPIKTEPVLIPGGQEPAAAAPVQEQPPAPRPAPASYERPKPVVGIVVPGSPEASENSPVGRCAKSIAEFGGKVQFIVPDGRSAKELLDGVHAVLLPAGETLQNPTVLQQGDFDSREIALAQEVLKTDTPMRGIGRGEHVLNAAAGGNSRPASHGGIDHLNPHAVIVQGGTHMRQALGQDILKVDSHHDTVIGDLGKEMIPVAIAADGAAEGIEYARNKKVIGVQFSPEALGETSDLRRQFFRTLVEDADRRRIALLPPPEQPKPTSWSSSNTYTTSPSSSSSRSEGPPQLNLYDKSVARRKGFDVLRQHCDLVCYGSPVQTVQAVDQGYQFTISRRGEKDMQITRSELEDVMLSLTKDGRDFLPPWKAEALGYVQALKKMGCSFSKPGVLWGSTPLPMDMQPVWNLQEGVNIEGRGQKLKVQSPDELRRAIDTFRQPANSYPYSGKR